MFEIVSICRGGGYRYCRTEPPHPKANGKGLYPLHRVLVENRIGRLLSPDEIVHHKDGDGTNDDGANLELMRRDEHSQHHSNERAPSPVVMTCVCGAAIELKPYVYRYRSRRNPSGAVYCSRTCAGRKL